MAVPCPPLQSDLHGGRAASCCDCLILAGLLNACALAPLCNAQSAYCFPPIHCNVVPCSFQTGLAHSRF